MKKKNIFGLVVIFTLATMFCFVNAQDLAALQQVLQTQNMQVAPAKSQLQAMPTTVNSIMPNAPDYTDVTATTEEVTPKFQLSAIEESFNNENSVSNLTQIGYDFFQNFPKQGLGRYNDNYALNIGQKVKIYFWGDSVDMLNLTGSSIISPLAESVVDSNGNIFVQGVGLVKAEGKTLQDVENNIKSLSNKKYTNIKVKVTVADANEFAVFVYGYVNKPGKINISNNSSIIEALAAAGGINKNGTLRSVAYKSGKMTKNIDFYDVILSGKTDNNVMIKPGDVIYVPRIGDVTAVKNGVKVPGIYEVKPGESLNTIISFAGGFLPSTSDKVVNIKSYDAKLGQRVSTDISSPVYSKTRLANGDIVEFKNLYGNAENCVTLKGNVKHPGIFQYKNGMKLSNVIQDKNELLLDTLICQVVIKRIVGPDRVLTTIPVSLNDFFEGGSNPDLNPNDVVEVFRGTSTAFVEAYGCINNPKVVPYGDGLTLKDVLANVQFITPSNGIQNVSLKADKNSEAKLIGIDNKSVDEEVGISGAVIKTSTDNVLLSAEDVAVEITNPRNPEAKIFYLYDVLVKNDITSTINLNPDDKVLFRPLRENELIKTVKVSGYVNQPGVYNFIDGKRLSDMIQTAGGLRKEANFKYVVLKRESLASEKRKTKEIKNQKDIKQIEGQLASKKEGDMVPEEAKLQEQIIENIKKDNALNEYDGRIVLNIKSNDPDKLSDSQNILIQDGDEIYIPRLLNHVTVMGEVYNEASFVYQPGQSARHYIRLVGGYTPNAKRLKMYKVSANGKARRVRVASISKVEPGDTIVVPRKIKGNTDLIEGIKSALQIFTSAMSTIFIMTKI